MAISATSKVVSFLTSSSATLTPCRPLACSAAAMGSFSPRIAPHPLDLIRWVKKEGGFVHPSLKIADNADNGLGVVSSGEIEKGTVLIALPEHIHLRLRWSNDSDNVNERVDSPFFQLVHRVPEELWAMRLGLKLLQERATVGSFWWPYISNLPETFSTPIFFYGEEIKNLQYAPLIYQVNKRCRFLLDLEKETKNKLEGVKPEDHPFCGQDVNASSLGWAMSAVSSRAFRLHGDLSSDGMFADSPMLLPLIDMCNHSFQPNARIIQQQGSSNEKTLVQVAAESPIECGASVTLNYGNLSNDFFLLDYGFVVPSNPYDCIELNYDEGLLDAASIAAGVSALSFSSPAPWQQEILSQLKLHGDGALLKITLGGPGLVDGRLLASLRVLLASDRDAVQSISLNTLKSTTEESPLGVSTEAAALRIVIALCAISLQHFPTKIMEDEIAIKKNISSAMELAIQFRMQKKSMIIDVMRKLSKKIRLLTLENPST